MGGGDDGGRFWRWLRNATAVHVHARWEGAGRGILSTPGVLLSALGMLLSAPGALLSAPGAPRKRLKVACGGLSRQIRENPQNPYEYAALFWMQHGCMSGEKQRTGDPAPCPL